MRGHVQEVKELLEIWDQFKWLGLPNEEFGEFYEWRRKPRKDECLCEICGRRIGYSMGRVIGGRLHCDVCFSTY